MEREQSRPATPKICPLVSVVVPTKDSIRTIERCLRSIQEQTWPAVELVVIDNYSVDGTWEVAEQLADIAIQAGPERSAQRNLGIEYSSGDWVMWIDSDMELPPSILQRAMDATANADGVFIPEKTVGIGYWTRCRALERSCCTEEVFVQSPRLVRRQYMIETGGFVTSLSGTEDAELRSRMLEDACTLTWIPDLIVHDEGRITLGSILRKRYYYGRGLASYKRDHPGALAVQTRAAIGAYRRNWRRLVAQPLVAAGVVFMRGAELAAYGLGAFVGAKEARGDTAS
jgi:glycosyltransferase involved in cell wall biosynthesis